MTSADRPVLAALHAALAPGLTGALLLLALSGGCSRGGRSFENENDVLRARVLDLEESVARLEGRCRELEAEVASQGASAGGEALGALSPEVRASIPHVAGISIGRWSGVADVDPDGEGEGTPDGRPDLLRVYVKPVDGRGRFVQLAGELSLHAAILPASGEAVTIARTSLTAPEVRDAWRGGMLSTHYTIEAPLELPDDLAGLESCDVRVEYTDVRTGQTFEAHREIELR